MSPVKRLIAARFLYNLAFAAPIQTLFFQMRGLSLGQIMLLQSLLIGVALLLEVPTGIIGDRVGKKWSIVCGIGCTLIAWVPWLMAENFWMFGMAFALMGISQAFISGADQALIYDLLAHDGKQSQMKKTYGLYLAMSTIGYAIAGLIGGFLAINQTLPEFIRLYVLTAAAQSAAFLLYLSVNDPAPSKEANVSIIPSVDILKSSLNLFAHNAVFRKIVLLSLFTTPFSVVLFTLFQPYFVEAGVEPAWFGIALFLSSIAATLSKLFAYKLENSLGIGMSVFIATLLPGLMWISMATTMVPAAVVLLFIANDAAGNIRDPIFADYLNRHIPSTIRATTLSLVSFITSCYLLLIQPLIGFLADENMKMSFLLMGVLIMLGAIFMRIGDVELKEK